MSLSVKSDGSDTVSEFSSEKVSTRGADDEEEIDLEGKSALGKLTNFVKRQGRAFVRNFVDYGPPYSKTPFDVALINECSKPMLNIVELHKLLNTRLNPNLPDPEDLYYTPTHWCARNCHYMGLQMLFRAGANPNVTNELGNTPLDLAVMMQHPDRRGAQLKCVLYLLKHGADPNSRDKGGYSAIDHAAVNQDLELITMLIEFGAKVMRENYIFVGARHHILSKVHNPECYKLLYEKLLQEENDAFSKQIAQQKRNFVVDDDIRHERLHKALSKSKQKRLDRLKALEHAKRTDDIQNQRLDKLRVEMEKNLKAKESRKAENGLWTRDLAGHWDFQPNRFAPLSSDMIYEANKATMGLLKREHSVGNYNKLWFHLTDKGRIEVPWTKADPFELHDGVRSTSSQKTNSGVNKMSNNVEYRDENDEELVGEDLNDMIEQLKNI